MFFYELLVRQKHYPKSQLSPTLADKLKKCFWFGRGWRERRCAGEEKGEGFSCLSSKIAGEHPVKGSARRSEGGGGSMDFRRPPIFGLLGVSYCGLMALCFMSLGVCRFAQIAPDMSR